MNIEINATEAGLITSAIRGRITQAEAIASDTQFAAPVRAIYTSQAETLRGLVSRIELEANREERNPLRAIVVKLVSQR